ncbi:IclR family transcriptional regulator [Catellatospora coxensis]
MRPRLAGHRPDRQRLPARGAHADGQLRLHRRRPGAGARQRRDGRDRGGHRGDGAPGRLEGAEVIYTAKRESKHPLRMYSAVGRRLPAYSTALGRAMLAEMPEDVRGTFVPHQIKAITSQTITNRDALLATIDKAAQLGYAEETEESCLGVRCFGVALPFSHQSVDALSIAVPISRLKKGREDFIIETLLSVKARLSAMRDNRLVR